MIYIIGNTLFGFPKMIDNQIDFFNNSFIPYIKKVSRDGDILIHTGNIFHNPKTVEFKTLKEIISIFENISKYLPIYILKGKNDEQSIDLFNNIKNVKLIKEIKKTKNIMFIPSSEMLMIDNDCDYVFYHHPLIEMKNIKRSFNGYFYNKDNTSQNVNVLSPYQLEESSNIIYGILKFNIGSNELEMIENNHSPKFINVNINKIDDLEEINTNSKHFISFYINHEILSKIENKNKLDMFLSKCNYYNVHYVNVKPEENVIVEGDSSNIRNVLIENIDHDLKNDLHEIFRIYDEK